MSSLFLGRAKPVKTGYMGDIMSFYIAQRNKETGVFNLWMKEDRPHQYYTIESAIDAYKLAYHAEGHNNVLLLESIDLDIEVIIKKHNQKKENKS